MAFQIDHTVDALRNYALFFICKLGPFGGSIVTQFLDVITDELKGVRGSEQVTNIINPFWVVLRGLVSNLKFVLQRTIGDNNTLLIEL